MVNQAKALERLNKEKDYEERISEHLSVYFLASLDNISGITEEEKKKIEEGINKIMNESVKHTHMFENLIQMVLENGENKY